MPVPAFDGSVMIGGELENKETFVLVLQTGGVEKDDNGKFVVLNFVYLSKDEPKVLKHIDLYENEKKLPNLINNKINEELNRIQGKLLVTTKDIAFIISNIVSYVREKFKWADGEE